MPDNRPQWTLKALKEMGRRGVGQMPGGMGATAIDRLAELDACTLAYRTWSPRVVPGLLQTPAYTAGAIKSHTPDLEPADLGLLVTHRRVRSDAFFGRRAEINSQAWFLVGEEAIRYPLMNAYSHVEQLRHLLAIIEAPNNIIVQVVPVDLPVPVTAEPFSLFALDPGPVLAHLETVVGGFYTILPQDTTRLASMFSDMVGRAMSMHDSREFIREELYACSGPISEPSAELDS